MANFVLFTTHFKQVHLANKFILITLQIALKFVVFNTC